MIQLYQAEWCPYSHRVRAKLTELGLEYQAINVPAVSKKRTKVQELTGASSIPVMVDGGKVIKDSSDIIAYLEEKYPPDPEDARQQQNALSPTISETVTLTPQETLNRLREALTRDGFKIAGEIDLSSALSGGGAYHLILALDPDFIQEAARVDVGAASLALMKIAVYEQDDSTAVSFVEPEKSAAYLRDPAIYAKGLELRKSLIRIIRSLTR